MPGMIYYIITMLKAIIITPIITVVTKLNVLIFSFFFFPHKFNNRGGIKSGDKVRRKLISEI